MVLGVGRQRRGGSTQTPTRIEDVFSERVLADPMVDRDLLNDLLRDPSPLRVDEQGEPDASPEVREEPETTVARVAKLTGLVIAVALLCGSLVTAVFLDRHRTAASQTPRPEQEITGIAALAAFATTAQPPEVGTRVTERAVTVPVDDAASSAPQTTSNPATRVSTQAEIGGFVRDFYHRFTDGPDDALAMLGGNLLDSRPDVLADALRVIDAVTVHRVSVGPDGLVRAVITMTRADSQRYRVTHLLRVEAGPPALITEARLLSAQHSPRP
ncbi:MAG: hypothetical protein GEV04_00615 [Actinophytocola sp.]|nr:hypothetical protein [Actinophytocola sp.]